ncbi:MAG: hypothetical protein BGN96_01870 [Bacteroidales bacterium 45-6]|nr:MAG: hypothetical protein BGN96_01870 [Bacteroidales bacterium 45-6]
MLHTAFAQQIEQSPVLVKGELKNGLKYYIYPNSYPKGEAVYRLFIRVGSVNESDSQRGLAHFLEHMAFNGSTHFPGNSLVSFLESKGAKFGKDMNAHTSFNETVYKLQLPSRNLRLVDSTLTILHDMANGLLLDSTDIEEERGVILSEWLSKTGPQADANNALLMDLLNRSRFAERIVIGDTAVIRNFKREELLHFYQQWYQPQLMAVAVVGDVDPSAVQQMIVDKFGGMKSHPVPNVKSSIDDYASDNARIVVNKSLKKVELSCIQLLPKAKPIRTHPEYVEYLSYQMLNRLMKARLNSLSFKNPSYKSASIGVSDFLNEKKVLLSTVELNPTDLKMGIRDFSTQINQMFSYGFLQQEIDKQKKIYLNLVKNRAETKSPVSSDGLMDEIYADFFKGNTVTSASEEYALLSKYIGSVDSTSMVKLLKKIVRPDKTHHLLTAFGDAGKQFQSDADLLAFLRKVQKLPTIPYRNDLDSVPDQLLPEEPTAARVVKDDSIPEIGARQLELSNGVTVIFKRAVTEKDRILLSGFRSRGAYSLDPSDYVTGVVAGSIVGLSGAGEFSREALSHALAGSSASVRFLIDKSRSGVSGSANLRDAETLFQLMYLKWNYPRVDSSVFSQMKEKSIQEYRSKNKTDESRFFDDFFALLKDSDYTSQELTDRVLETEMKIERVLPVFENSFGKASGYTFVVMADCDLDRLKPLILTYVGGLPSGNALSSYAYDGGKIRTTAASLRRQAGDSPKATVSLVYQHQQVQGGLAVFNLRNQVLCEVVKMKLLAELREKMGMVYSVSVASGATLYPAPLSRNTISFKCLPENADLLVETTQDILDQMQKSPATLETALNDVKTNLIKTMKAERQKDSFWIGQIRNKIYNVEGDWDFLVRYDELVESITKEQLASAIPLFFDRARLIKGILLPKREQTNKNR